MQQLFREICLRVVVIPSPGRTVINHISSWFADFQPDRVILLEELAKELWVGAYRHNGPPGRSDFLDYVRGPSAKVCKRYCLSAWEMLTSDDQEKCEHLAANVMVLHDFFETGRKRVR